MNKLATLPCPVCGKMVPVDLEIHDQSQKCGSCGKEFDESFFQDARRLHDTINEKERLMLEYWINKKRF